MDEQAFAETPEMTAFYDRLNSQDAEKAREDAKIINAAEIRMGLDVCAIGLALCRQQAALKKKFRKWVNLGFGYGGDQQARRFMHVATNIGPDQIHRYQHLGFSVICRLAAPNVKPELREEILERSAQGERITVKLVEARIKEQNKVPWMRQRRGAAGPSRDTGPDTLVPKDYNEDNPPESVVESEYLRLHNFMAGVLWAGVKRYYVRNRIHIEKVFAEEDRRKDAEWEEIDRQSDRQTQLPFLEYHGTHYDRSAEPTDA